ncbi:MATE family efflux transporter [Fulvivirgaceae bacterium BMA10]|uniref:MATE family efflux transporter n=1 Tax=Splendidivirga corallicola TaxID=3051826 RepID=A0ABT8KVF9_9BACT|nr:MATE family efflux transporter [Fulvivirgaceae bacterium BMA10]
MSKSIDLGKDPIRSLFFKYYFPVLTSTISVAIHQLVDGIILGHYVGKEGVAAIGLYVPVLTILIAFLLTLMMGGAILISKNIGAKKYNKAQQVFQFTTTIVLFMGLTITISAPFITKPIAHFIAGSENELIFKYLSDYMFWSFIFIPFLFLRSLWGIFLNNDGAPKVSKNATLFASILNILLDVLLVIVFPFEVAGASVATGISLMTATLYIYFYIKKGKGHLSFQNFRFTFKLKKWKALLSTGFPSFVSEITFSTGFLLINQYLLPYGNLAIAAFGLINYLSIILLRIFIAAMIAVQPIMAFNIGAKSPGRVLSTLIFSLFFTFIVGVSATGIGFIFPSLLINMFSSEETMAFKQLAEWALLLYFTLYLAAGPNYILSIYMQTIGKSTLSVIINTMKGLALVAVLLFLLPKYLNMGLDGIWLARPLAEIGTLLFIVFFTLFKRKTYYSHEVILSSDSNK